MSRGERLGVNKEMLEAPTPQDRTSELSRVYNEVLLRKIGVTNIPVICIQAVIWVLLDAMVRDCEGTPRRFYGGDLRDNMR